MKKLMITACLSILLTSLSAQINKGDILIEGQVSYGQSNYEKGNKPSAYDSNNYYYDSSNYYSQKNTNLYLSPRVGFFVSETFLLGLGIGYQHSKDNYTYYRSNGSYDHYPSYDENKYNMVSINPYFTKYHKLGEKLYLNYTFNIYAGIGTKVNEQYDDENPSDIEKEEKKLTEIGVNLTPGLTYFVSEKIAFTANIGRLYYNSTTEKLQDVEDEPKTTRQNYGLNLSLNTFTLGFQFYLR